ncbi:MAG TPA: dTDP-4-dehydrorhamnose reductase [Alphaproteobacteria bacterium]|nr:dTDP-4-dehydrorhamnose reductase [Alphaproteobacteria bacterium]
MTRRVMLLGASGQIGQALRAQPAPKDWYIHAYSRAECDITDHLAVKNVIQKLQPELIINAAAMTAVDVCEKELDNARKVNFDGPANLAAQCSVSDIPLIHISTDYVFDGKATTPYTVDAPMSPVNAYGESKMLGEEAVRHELAWHVILRISSVFGAFGNNLLTRTMKSIDERDELKCVTDQTACPTAAQDVAEAIVTMGDAILRGKVNGFGTFHLAGTPPCNRLEFVQAIMEAYAPFTKKRPQILPALTSDFPGLAERPAYAVLDCTKIANVYGIQQRPWRDGLKEAMQELMR